jgi:lipoprotein NlpI
MPYLLAMICVLLAAVPCYAEDANSLEGADKAMLAGDLSQARKLAAAVAQADPKNAAAFLLVGRSSLGLRDNAAAIEAFSKVLQLEPDTISALDGRGDAYLKAGQFAAAVADFDRMLELVPAFAPQHWRRGIALYYAGKYDEGVQQFETHKLANPQDVENAVWHYLCNVHMAGPDEARKQLIDVTQDSRVPMKQIQKLFAGKLQPADVLSTAEAVDAKTLAGKEARFYAHLYVGLWHEAEGNAKQAKAHLTTAAKDYKISHYMWDVANAHVQSLQK